MKHIKYTKEMLSNIVKNSYSTAQVIRQLGLVISGGNYWYITKKILSYGLDTSHFKRQGINRGKSPASKKTWIEVLVKNPDGKRTVVSAVRKALIESGREYKCEECSLKNEWNNKPLCIQVEHMDGDGSNNLPENLKFLCPNCHTQTPTFGVGNVEYPKKIKRCSACDIDFFYKRGSNRKYCSYKCSNRRENKTIKTKIVWPERNILLKMLAESNYRQLGIRLGVSDSSIRKHLRS